MGLASSQQEPHRQAVLIDDGVDLGARSSTRTADAAIRDLFQPEACWWGRMIELSISDIEPGDLADKGSNTRNHTPAWAQRLKRL